MRVAFCAGSLLLVLACDNQKDVILGAISSGTGGSAAGGSGGSASTGPDVCDSRGLTSGTTRRFVDLSAPGNSAALFAGAECEASDRVSLLYPSDETKLPVNLPPLHCAWSSDVEDALFELELRGESIQVLVYTRTPSWSPSAALWAEIVAASTPALTLRVRAMSSNRPTQALESPRVRVHFGGALPDTPIYYFSSTAHGLMRSRLGSASAERLTAPAGPGEGAACVGCHAMSRDGSRLALDVEGGRLRVLDTAEMLEAVVSGGSGGALPGPGKMDKTGPEAPAAWTAFSPDGTRIALASNGTLSLLDANGAPVGPDKGAVMLPEKSVVAHPDWSPLGDRLVFTLAEKGGGHSVEKGQIASMSFGSDRFGSLEILVPSQGGDDNNAFPSVSPDGGYVAFVNTRGKSYNSVESELRLLRLSDGFVFPLPRLNSRVNNRDGVLDLGNSMPTWASSPGGTELWLAFSSLRAYGLLRAEDPKLEQIWLAAVDPLAPDPAYPAFWAPFQRLSHGNHRALWGGPLETANCSCHELCSDGIDNDCDGSTDEPDCVASCDDRELCGDGIDNDCDCVIDDCPGEDCSDGLDNDGDGQVDGADALCKASQG